MGIVSRSTSGGGITKVTAAQLSRAVGVGGNITLANTAGVMAELAGAAGGPGAGGLDLTIAASTSDVLLVNGMVTFANTTAIAPSFDFATWVTGAAVNWLGQSAAVSTNNGLAFMGSAVAGTLVFATQYVVQAGDITGGNVVLRLHYGSTGARIVSRSVLSGPLILSAANLLH